MPGREGAQSVPATPSPPTSRESEMALLGALLQSNGIFWQVSDFLEPQHFADYRHGEIFQAAGTLIEAGNAAEPVTLTDYFRSTGALDDIGGAEYLARLAATPVVVATAPQYAQTIVDRAIRRQLMVFAQDTLAQAATIEIDDTAEDLLARTEQTIQDIASGDTSGKGLVLAASAASDALGHKARIQRGEVSPGLNSPIEALTAMLGGLQPGMLIILGGRTSMGKTALALAFAHQIAESYEPDPEKPRTAKHGGVVGFFTLEMTNEEMADRLLSLRTGITLTRVRRAQDLVRDENVRLAEEADAMRSRPLYIDDTAGLTVRALRARARRLQRKYGLDLIVVDYLQLMGVADRSGWQKRHEALGEVSRGLKQIAKELKVPVIALAQVSRAVESRNDRRPTLADLRESGDIEQDADVVMFVFREEYYLERSQPDANDIDEYAEWQDKMNRGRGKAEIQVAKNRNGPTGKVECRFKAEIGAFSELDQMEERI